MSNDQPDFFCPYSVQIIEFWCDVDVDVHVVMPKDVRSLPKFNSPRRRRNRSFVNMRTLLEDTNRVDDETTRCKNLTSMSFF